MANTLFTPEQAASVAANLLFGDLAVAGTFSRDVEADFGGGSGSTVYVRVPSALPGRDRPVNDKNPITVDSLNELSHPVSLDFQAYSSVEITDAERSLHIEDFGRRVLLPQTRAVRGRIERAALDALNNVTPMASPPAYDDAAPSKTFSAIRRAFRASGVDADATLVAVVGIDAYADLLDAPERRGLDAPSVQAFQIVESDKVGDGEIIAYAKQAFVLAVRAPKAPEGVPFSASVATDAGAALHVMGYDLSRLVDQSVVSAFVGASEVPLYVVDEAGNRTVVPGAYRIDTAA